MQETINLLDYRKLRKQKHDLGKAKTQYWTLIDKRNEAPNDEKKYYTALEELEGKDINLKHCTSGTRAHDQTHFPLVFVREGWVGRVGKDINGVGN